ncbi:hypothetical protein J7I84_06890 [Arthrobacter sp. ISL-85]|uniref:hypothetical protein n=1 Tax=Arthrobacter sp. ISL-85 TaxID=2819115 RepID=UPI001BE9A8F8|nr:hypothetical protein [Arthrobacter sp. ISL-85]MBT2566227.1 hypothetical protein [Arthrobacter sp. ISL-85]
MERVLLDQVIQTDYGQLDLSWGEDGYFDGDFDRSYQGQVNGLVGAARPTGVHINLARRSGGSPVRMVLLDAPPGSDGGQWEDVVEVSITVPEGQDVAWSAWVDMGGGPIDLPPGSYRLRVSANGRDEGHAGEFAEGTVDDYLLQFWRSPWQPDAIHRTGSEDARYWHREVGGRRQD